VAGLVESSHHAKMLEQIENIPDGAARDITDHIGCNFQSLCWLAHAELSSTKGEHFGIMASGHV
jgi:hypothetical protein